MEDFVEGLRLRSFARLRPAQDDRFSLGGEKWLDSVVGDAKVKNAGGVPALPLKTQRACGHGAQESCART